MAHHLDGQLHQFARIKCLLNGHEQILFRSLVNRAPASLAPLCGYQLPSPKSPPASSESSSRTSPPASGSPPPAPAPPPTPPRSAAESPRAGGEYRPKPRPNCSPLLDQ